MSASQHQMINELLGAYALHAVESAEATAIEAHLHECVICRAELDEFRHGASLLGSAGNEAPADVWSRISHSLETRGSAPFPLELDRGQAGAVTPMRIKNLTPPNKRRRTRTVGAIAAAATFLVGLTLGSVTAKESPAPATDDMALARVAMASPEARRVDLRPKSGEAHASAVVMPTGQGWVVSDALPPLPAGQTYQLWVFTSDTKTPISAGVLGGHFTAVSFTNSGDLRAIAITVEPTGGLPNPSSSPVVVGVV